MVYYLSYAVTIAGIFNYIFIFLCKKILLPKFNFQLKIDKKLKFFLKNLLPSIFSSGVTQINILVGTIIASFQASAVSYLYYADRIYQINLSYSWYCNWTVILPQLSKHIQSKKRIK